MPGPVRASLDEDLENVRAGWRWAVDGARAEEVRRGARPLVYFLAHRARFTEGLTAFQAAVDVLRGDDLDQRPALGAALVGQAWFAMRLGRYEEAQEWGEWGLALVSPGGPEASFGLYTLGSVAERTGAFAQAEQHFGEALDLARRHGLVPQQAGLLCNLANVAVCSGLHDRAEQQVQQAVALYERLGDRAGLVYGLDLQGYVALCRGQLAQAQAALTRSLALARELGILQRIPDILQNLAEVALERGDLGEARRLTEEALSLVRLDGHRSLEIGALTLLGRVSAHLGDDRQTRAHLERACHLARSAGETPRLLAGLAALAEWHLTRNEISQALPLLRLVGHHPAAEHRVAAQARGLLQGLEGPLPPLAPTSPTDLDALVDGVLARLDLAGIPVRLPRTWRWPILSPLCCGRDTATRFDRSRITGISRSVSHVGWERSGSAPAPGLAVMEGRTATFARLTGLTGQLSGSEGGCTVPMWRPGMYTRVVTVQIRQGKTEATVEIFRDALLPALREQEGFCGAHLLTDAGSGKGLMITLWESEAQMRANEASGFFREQLTRFGPVLSAPASAERYEVNVMV